VPAGAARWPGQGAERGGIETGPDGGQDRITRVVSASDGGDQMNRQLQTGQGKAVVELKAQLHRYIIDELEGEADNLLEGPRIALVRFVADRVAEYTRRSQFAISRYEEIGRAHV